MRLRVRGMAHDSAATWPAQVYAVVQLHGSRLVDWAGEFRAEQRQEADQWTHHPHREIYLVGTEQ